MNMKKFKNKWPLKFLYITLAVSIYCCLNLPPARVYSQSYYDERLENIAADSSTLNAEQKNNFNYDNQNQSSNKNKNKEIENEDTSLTPEGIMKTVNLSYSELVNFLKNLKNHKQKVSKIEVTFSDSENILLNYILKEVSEAQFELLIKRVEKILNLPVRWIKNNSDIENHAVLTGFVVDSSKKEFELKGITLKHRHIFNELFPILETVKGIENPFFREGNYSDYTNNRRIMRFVVSVQWNE